MLDSTTLEVAIGMAFVYLLLSLFCTAIREVIAGICGSRAKNLEIGIRNLFTGGLKSDAGEVDGKTIPAVSLADAIYSHGLIQSLYRSAADSSAESSKRKLPSYIPSRTFANALIDILFHSTESPVSIPGTSSGMLQSLKTLPDSKAKDAIRALILEANGDIGRLRKNFENWFDDGMDRAAGWYKRRTQLVLFLIGISLALILNIDSIAVGRSLWITPALRSYTVAQAEAYARNHPIASAADSSKASEDLETLQTLSIPIGWGGSNTAWISKGMSDSSFWSAALITAAGWLLTAIAVTLGAPFWFDVLNRIMVIRSTIKPREKSGVEASKDLN